MVVKRKTSIKEILSVKNFSKEDCQEVIEIYHTKRKSKVSWYLVQTKDVPDSMRRDLNEVLKYYRARKLRSYNLTAKDLKKRQRQIKNSANKLFNLLLEATDSQFIADIVAARAGTSSSIQLGDDKFGAVDGDLHSLGLTLNRLIDDLGLCLKKNSIDEFAKPMSRVEPETILIRKLSRVLTKYFENGGYARGTYGDKELVSGWRIECLKNLLDRVGISKTKAQIIDSL